MGAVFDGVTIRDARNDTEAVAFCRQAIRDAQWEYGHGGYSGTLAEADGAIVDTSKEFTSVQDAYDYLEDVAEKWGPAVGVRVKVDDKLLYVFGAWCSS